MGTKPRGERKPPQTKTPTFLLELLLAIEAGQAARLRATWKPGDSATTPCSQRDSGVYVV